MKKELSEKYLAAKKRFGGGYSKTKEKFNKKYSGTKKRFSRGYYKVSEKLNKRRTVNLKVRTIQVTLVQLIVVLVFLGIVAGSFSPKITGFIVENMKGEVEPEATSVSPPPSSPGPQLSNPLVSTSSQPAPAPSLSNSAPAPEPSPVNFQSLPARLSGSGIVQDFPKKAVVSLRFFTFVGGQRVWQKEYIIEKASVVEGKAENPDVIMILHSKYVDRVYNEDFCDIIKDAKKNGDLAFETQISKISLAWKFKSIIKYKSCIT